MTPVAVMVSVMLAPWATFTPVDAGVSVKLPPGAVIVKTSVLAHLAELVYVAV